MKISGHILHTCDNFLEHRPIHELSGYSVRSSSDVADLATLLPGVVLPFDTLARSE